MSAKKQLEKEIREAYTFLREKNQTIPSETLQFMLDASLEKLNLDNSKLPIFGVSDSFVNNLTVGSLIEKLNFAIENGYITNEHTILIGGNGDTCLVQNLTLPTVILDNDKEFKQVQMLFTKL